MFSSANCLRLCPPRPPEPIIAMFSFSFRFRPRTIAGAAKAPTAAPATVLANWRRVGRNAGRSAVEEGVWLMGTGSRVVGFNAERHGGARRPPMPFMIGQPLVESKPLAIAHRSIADRFR